MEQAVFSEEMARARVPIVGGIGVSMLGATLMAHGTESQVATHLPPIVRGDVVWAQGFSEPGAGSDLAALNTSAVREGDEYVLTGQKIWTSAAQHSDWICVLARTDPDEPRHRGLSFLLLDIETPGVTVRPITDMSWSEPFNEVFFDGARVPVENRVGEEHRGWYVAMAMLDFERAGIAGAVRVEEMLVDALDFVRAGARDGRSALRADWHTAARAQIADRAIEVEVVSQLARRTVSIQAAGEIPNYEASVNQVMRSELHQRVARTATKPLGLYANLWSRDRESAAAIFAREDLRAVPQTVLSGTSEIQRNLIATRGLGLPRS